MTHIRPDFIRGLLGRGETAYGLLERRLECYLREKNPRFLETGESDIEGDLPPYDA